MAAETQTIKDLILAASQGTAVGIQNLKDAGIPVYLEEFEIEVTYACTTEFSVTAELEAQIRFAIFKGSFKAKTTYSRTVTYGLKVRFLFTGKDE